MDKNIAVKLIQKYRLQDAPESLYAAGNLLLEMVDAGENFTDLEKELIELIIRPAIKKTEKKMGVQEF